MFLNRDILVLCNLCSCLPFNILTSNILAIMKLLLPLLFISFALISCQKDEVELKKEAPPITYDVLLELKNGGGDLVLNTSNKELNPDNFSHGAFDCKNTLTSKFTVKNGDLIIGGIDMTQCKMNDSEFPKKAYLTITAGNKVIRDSIVLTADKKYGTKVITME